MNTQNPKGAKRILKRTLEHPDTRFSNPYVIKELSRSRNRPTIILFDNKYIFRKQLRHGDARKKELSATRERVGSIVAAYITGGLVPKAKIVDAGEFTH